MPTYAIWNNKGGVGKSYLTFQIASEFARLHPDQKVLVIDVCPQANSSSMLLGGMIKGEKALEEFGTSDPRRTIAGYIRERISSPYHNPKTGAGFECQLSTINKHIPSNLFLVPGDGELEVLASRVSRAASPGPEDAWVKVHRWIYDLASDIRTSWNMESATVFIDCNPSFGIYTELALTAADRLIIPFSADGSSLRAVHTALALVYGVVRKGGERSEFVTNSAKFRVSVPRIYCYVGNRMTQANKESASAFKAVANAIGNAIYHVWQTDPGHFQVHPSGSAAPTTKAGFESMFRYEIVDANTASVVSSTLGIPIVSLTAKNYTIPGKIVKVNESQVSKQRPNIQKLVKTIE